MVGLNDQVARQTLTLTKKDNLQSTSVADGKGQTETFQPKKLESMNKVSSKASYKCKVKGNKFASKLAISTLHCSDEICDQLASHNDLQSIIVSTVNSSPGNKNQYNKKIDSKQDSKCIVKGKKFATKLASALKKIVTFGAIR